MKLSDINTLAILNKDNTIHKVTVLENLHPHTLSIFELSKLSQCNAFAFVRSLIDSATQDYAVSGLTVKIPYKNKDEYFDSLNKDETHLIFQDGKWMYALDDLN